MKPEDLLNWGELSRFLSGSRQTVRKNKIPIIHHEFVKELLKAMEKVIKNKIDKPAKCAEQVGERWEQKHTVTADFPGIGPVQISHERAEQIRRLQKIIKATH